MYSPAKGSVTFGGKTFDLPGVGGALLVTERLKLVSRNRKDVAVAQGGFLEADSEGDNTSFERGKYFGDKALVRTGYKVSLEHVTTHTLEKDSLVLNELA